MPILSNLPTRTDNQYHNYFFNILCMSIYIRSRIPRINSYLDKYILGLPPGNKPRLINQVNKTSTQFDCH